jgi:hypothetical protein
MRYREVNFRLREVSLALCDNEFVPAATHVCTVKANHKGIKFGTRPVGGAARSDARCYSLSRPAAVTEGSQEHDTVPVLSQMNPLRALQYHSFDINFNIIFTFTPGYSQWFFQFSFRTLHAFFSLPCVLHALSLSFSFNWSSWYLYKKTNYEASVLFFSLL